MLARPLILSCEHATPDVPPVLRALFKDAEALLESHRGWDAGASELAQKLARRLDAPLERAQVTRLIVDLNRSEYHPRLFSQFTAPLHPETRQAILEKYYRPFRTRVFRRAEACIERWGHVVHLSVHTFTPELDGVVRRADIGLLYDPSREAERALARRWKAGIEDEDRSLRIRMNSPYRGVSDGHTTALRDLFDPASYLGIELEVNQKFVLGSPSRWEEIQASLVESFSGLDEIRGDP